MAGNRNEEMVYCSFCGKNQEEVKENYRWEWRLYL